MVDIIWLQYEIEKTLVSSSPQQEKNNNGMRMNGMTM
jgi:hypothetical protein